MFAVSSKHQASNIGAQSEVVQPVDQQVNHAGIKRIVLLCAIERKRCDAEFIDVPKYFILSLGIGMILG